MCTRGKIVRDGECALVVSILILQRLYTVDQEIFTLKIICLKNFRVDIFSRFVRSAKFF